MQPKSQSPPIPPKSLKPIAQSVNKSDTIINPSGFLLPPRTSQTLPIQRKKKPGLSTEELIEQLKVLCNPKDPTKLYMNLVKIGQGY
jgi:hypothetical protein